jgi:hypothetical protein
MKTHSEIPRMHVALVVALLAASSVNIVLLYSCV